MEPVQYPDAVSIYENMGIEAARHNRGLGGAFRVWALGKAIDAQGLGMVHRDDLRAFALSLGIQRRTWERWVNEARNLDFVIDIQKYDGKMWFRLPSAGKVAAIMGCEKAGRKVTMPASFLVGKGWKANVFAAWRHEKRISQRTIKRITGVSVRTQVHRNAQADIKRIKNVAHSTMQCKGMNVHDLREMSGRQTAFVTREGTMAWLLPDYCEAAGVTTGHNGRSRKVNSDIRNAKREGLFLVQRALSNVEQSEQPVRLFCETKRQHEIAADKISEGTFGANDVYRYTGQTASNGAVIWTHQFA